MREYANGFNPNASVAIALRGTDNRAGEHRTVQAEVYGAWAVHLCGATETGVGDFSVSHALTGFAVKKGTGLIAARHLAKQLQDYAPEFESIDTPAWRVAAPIIKKLVLQCP